MQTIYCQTLYSTTSLHHNGATSLGRVDANLFERDVWSSINAIANTSYLKESEIGVTHRWNNQQIGFSTYGLAAVIPLPKVNLFSSIQRFGDDIFHEQSFGIGISHQLGIIRMASSLNHYQLGGDFLRRLNALTINFGINTQLSDQLELSFHAHNIFNASYSNEDVLITVPSLFSVGIAYSIDDDLKLTTQIDKETYQEFYSKTSLSYRMSKYLEICTGVGLYPLKLGTGFKLDLRKWNLGYGVLIHQILPWSHAFSLSFNLT